MRSLWSQVIQGWRKGEAHQGTNRPEALRNDAVLANAGLLAVAGLIGMAASAQPLARGDVLAAILALVGIAAGVLGLALCRRNEHRTAATVQVAATLAAGLLLTITDPALFDAGIAVALLAPVQGALLRPTEKLRSWAWPAAVLAASAVGAMTGFAGAAPERGLLEGVVLAVAAAMVAVPASRLAAAIAVVERDQHHGYKHLLEHLQDAVLRFAPSGEVTYASHATEKLLGCRRFELTANGLGERVHVLDRPAYLTAFAEASGDGKTRRIDIRMRRDDATVAAPQYVWVEVSLSPVIGREPQERHEVVVLLRDITDRHDHEVELQRARKAAEEASVAKSRFLATIGHELRTPLNAIVGFSEMMTSGVAGELSPPHKEYAALIRQSGHHLIDVVKMLLDMSRLEAGKFELMAEPFAPETLAEPCLRMVDAMAAEKSIRLMTDIPRALPMLVADERVCRQILINLLSNAIKFSHERSVVTLGMRRQGRHVAISVTDQGIGMGEESIRRIGEPFFQAQDGLSRRYEGTGLGLSIVKGLVELHEGTLHANSSPGQGTVMTVLLPINGPETKLGETESVTPLHRDAVPKHMPTWLEDERKRAL